MNLMKPEPYFKISALLFLLTAAIHGYSAINELPMTIGDTELPVWGSWIILIAGLYLAWSGYKNYSR